MVFIRRYDDGDDTEFPPLDEKLPISYQVPGIFLLDLTTSSIPCVYLWCCTAYVRIVRIVCTYAHSRGNDDKRDDDDDINNANNRTTHQQRATNNSFEPQARL